MAGKGLRFARSQGMEGSSGNLNEFAIDPANTNPMFSGDPVTLDANGFIGPASGNASSDDFDIFGIFQGCRFVDGDGSYDFRPYWDGGAGRTNVRAHVVFPAHAIFEIRGAAAGIYTQANTVGKRFGITYAAGATRYGDSRISLGAAAAAGGPLFVHKICEYPGNVFGAAEPWFEVSIIRPQGLYIPPAAVA